MVRLPPLVLTACVVCAGLILVEFPSTINFRLPFGAHSPPTEIKPAAPKDRKLADTLLGATQHRLEAAPSANEADSPLRDVRLTGVVIGPGLRIAIFAVTGTNPLVLSEGEALKGWRLDSISPDKVVLTGQAGNIELRPKPDAKLVGSPPPVAAWSGQFEPSAPPGAAMAGPPGPPMAVTPISVVNLSLSTPTQAQSYPYYPPQYYPGYDQYFPPYGDFAYPYPFFSSVVLKKVGFRFGVFHHHFVHFGGFPNFGGFHKGAFHGRGFGGHR